MVMILWSRYHTNFTETLERAVKIVMYTNTKHIFTNTRFSSKHSFTDEHHCFSQQVGILVKKDPAVYVKSTDTKNR